MKINKDIKINKKEYEYWGQWKQPVLSDWFWIEWHKTPVLKEVSDDIKFHPFLYLDGHFWTQNPDRSEIFKTAKNIFQNNGAEEYLKNVDSIFNKYEKKYLGILQNLYLDKYKYVEQLFEESANIAALWSYAMFFTEDLAKIATTNGLASTEKELSDRVEKVTPQTWLEKQNFEIKAFAGVAVSLGLNEINFSILEKNVGLKHKIEKHVDEFKWFGTHHWMGEGYDINKCLEQINDAIKIYKKPGAEIKNNEKNSAIKLIASGVYWRTHFAELTAKVVYESRKTLESIGKLVGLNYEELIYLSGPEVLSINKDSDGKLLKQVIDVRKNKGYGCITENNNVAIVTGEELKSLISQMITQEDVKNIKEFKGSVASWGPLLRGIVKIIISPDDFSKFKDGEILVAPETTPDYVPIMKRAVAIITDVGGITSHAAIVSRELGKPCIIGTKIATKILKDGDLAEVDANNGIVKILRKV